MPGESFTLNRATGQERSKWVPWDGTGAINFTAGGKKYDFYQKQGWITGTIDGVSHAFIQEGGRIFIAFAADGTPFFGKVPS
ncbi:hypothetical protein [Microbispora sp. CA-102843]|uniref:hypothetical protein n=1 Tax=Microbispora sp. CA-102843 TaxID=3239952 RepID=UPI003D89DC87